MLIDGLFLSYDSEITHFIGHFATHDNTTITRHTIQIEWKTCSQKDLYYKVPDVIQFDIFIPFDILQRISYL